MHLAYSKSHKLFVLVEDLDTDDLICTPIGDDTGVKIFTSSEDLEIKGKLQPDNSEIAVRSQPDNSEITVAQKENNSRITAIQKARKHLPPALTLKEEVQEKWLLLVALSDPKCFEGTTVKNFKEMLKEFRKGKRKHVPRQAQSAVNQALGTKYTNPVFTRAINLFTEYEKELRKDWFFYIDQGLTFIDNILNSILLMR